MEPKKQEYLNKRILKYFRTRQKHYRYCTKESIKSEELRATSIDNFELAEAIKQALERIQKNQK